MDTKMCAVCGLEVSENTVECPNCGSYTFKKIEKKKRFKFN